MHILFPGRHHLLTDYQFKYIYRLIQAGLDGVLDINGETIKTNSKIEDIIFAVTSCNHSNTRRNPIPFYIRAMALSDFSREFDIPIFIAGIDDVGKIDNFAEYTLKKIEHELDGRFDLTPENTVVICSTPVLEGYEKLGFRILPAELIDRKTRAYKTELPWELVEKIAYSEEDWKKNGEVLEKTHPSSYWIWKNYNIGERVKILFCDSMIGDDGDLTETRDYNTYVRQMDDIALLKYNETSPYIKPGRIGDIGCAVGSWIKLACNENKFHESDFYGIEVARVLYDLCIQRKNNREFLNPNVFFSQKNAVTGLVFQPNSMNTIHTSSLTHEIESYGGRDDLLKFIKFRYMELSLHGVWINRDVVGPENKEKYVFMKLNKEDGRNTDYDKKFDDKSKFKSYLDELSTFGRFLRFAIDFRSKYGYKLQYSVKTLNGVEYVYLNLKDACEFMSRKDYTDNWSSEMNETFCFWSFSEWKDNMEKAGFIIDPRSNAYCNRWIVENRFIGKVELYTLDEGKLNKMEYPVTNMLLIAEK
ncbi:MAG TPA: transferase [Spirochaetota bacterium]|jgi:hypothetical protein|nr:MAG: hypothetical protein BWX91_01422 [Spirochaetes bacterium ADurb.Bin133]HNZ25718.1 transferase [Spirochaetota bacterium]